MPNLVTATPIPFDDAVLPFTKTDSFFGSGNFLQWSNAGPYEAAGKLWRVCLNVVPTSGVNPANFLNVYASADGGSTWAEQDAANNPQLTTLGTGDAPRIDCTFGHDGVLYSLCAPSGVVGGTHITLQRFDTGTGLWLTAIVGPLTHTADGLINDISIYQNSTNTNLIVFYDRTSGIDNAIFWTRVTAGVFGAENVLRAAAVTNFAGLAAIDSTDVARVFFSDAGVSTYQAINTDDSLGVAVVTGWDVGTGASVAIWGKPLVWQGVIAMPALGSVAATSQPFALIASPATGPAAFTATQIFDETVPSSLTTNDNGLRMAVDGAGALWAAWMAFSHSPGGGGDPVTVSQIGMAQLCSPSGAWGNHRVFWDQLTNPQTDQPLNDPDALVFGNFSLSYLAGNDTFGGIANIAGFDNTYAYYLQSTTAVASITACGSGSSQVTCSITIYAKQYLFGSSQQLVCDTRYPWSIPPEQRTPWNQQGSIAAPALGVIAEIWEYLIPEGFYLVIDRIMHAFAPPGLFVDGAGAVVWLIDVNSPLSSPLATWRPIAQFTAQIGSFGKSFPVGPLQFRGGDTVRYKAVITDPAVPVGPPNIITALAEGWLYPVARSAV